MGNIEGSQFEAPAPIPRGVSPGAKKFHLYRLIVSLYEQLAVLRVTAHTHTAAGEFEAVKGTQIEAPAPIPRGVSPGYKDEHLYQLIVSLYEQLASLKPAVHGHAGTGEVEAVSNIEGTQIEAPAPIPWGVSPSYKDEHLYRLIVSQHEQMIALRGTSHLHTAIGVALPR